jgi:16S rRNA (uracil1498-N3)-methyltransferase
MKIKNRLYLNREINLKLIIDFNSKQSHYLSKVLRCKLTDHISVFNEGAEYLVELLEINSKKAKGIVVKKIKSLRKSSLLTLYFSPIKKTPTEILIQKCSEIGVNIFQPIIMEHTQFSTFNVERLKLIAIEAIEQSGQILVPKINIPIHFNDFIKNLDSNENIYACSLSPESISISKALSVN